MLWGFSFIPPLFLLIHSCTEGKPVMRFKHFVYRYLRGALSFSESFDLMGPLVFLAFVMIWHQHEVLHIFLGLKPWNKFPFDACFRLKSRQRWWKKKCGNFLCSVFKGKSAGHSNFFLCLGTFFTFSSFLKDIFALFRICSWLFFPVCSWKHSASFSGCLHFKSEICSDSNCCFLLGTASFLSGMLFKFFLCL